MWKIEPVKSKKSTIKSWFGKREPEQWIIRSSLSDHEYKKCGSLWCAIAIEDDFVVTIIARIKHHSKPKVVGIGKVYSSGIANGMVVDIDDAAVAIRESLSRAAKSGKYKVDSAMICMPVSSVGLLPIDSTVPSSDSRRILTYSEFRELHSLLDRTYMRQIVLSFGRYVGKDWVVENIAQVNNVPDELIESYSQFVFWHIAGFENLLQALEKVHIDADVFYFDFWIAGYSMFTEEERNLEHAAIIRIRKTYIEVALFEKGDFKELYRLPFANRLTGYQAANAGIPSADEMLDIIVSDIDLRYLEKTVLLFGEPSLVRSIGTTNYKKYGIANIRVLNPKGIKGMEKYQDDTSIIGCLAGIMQFDRYN